MKIPSRRKLGAAALIIAGLVAVAVPFMLLHGSTPQGTSPNPPTPSGNNGGTKTPTTTGSGGTSDSGGGGSGGTSTCSETKSSHPHSDTDPTSQTNGNGEHNGNAYGVLKNRLDTTVALVKSMGTHDPAYHLHHDTDTDNDAAHGHHSSVHDPSDHDSSCAAGEEDHEQD
jgi:hypothetical protein